MSVRASSDPGPIADRDRRLARILDELHAILGRMDDFEVEYSGQLAEVHGRQRRGAANLVDYLALRQTDTTGLEDDLAELGLASLTRVGAHAHASIEALVAAIECLRGTHCTPRPGRVARGTGRARIRRQTQRLLGSKKAGATVRIMVTMPTEASEDYDLVLDMVRAGMNVARINCAHDGPEAWLRMIEHVRSAAKVEGREVRVFMDLAGPKIRIGSVAAAADTETAGSKPAKAPKLTLRDDDVLTLHKDPRPGESPVPSDAEGGPRPGHVSCTMPEIIDALRVGHTVFIDDGKVRGAVVAVREGEADVRIERAGKGGTKVKGFKGLNLPDTELGLFGLTAKDREDMRFVVDHADGVNVSFINHPDDVEDLLDELDKIGGGHLGLVLKIETRGGVTHLPGILMAAMEWPTVGVMVARGDLAVEAGWLELAEVVEEILMLCEAAHIPTIWATEVLDRLAKKGVPARGEVSDVIMAGRAECVMLNKGPYITWAIQGLDLVLASFQAYRDRKATRLPALRLELPDPEEVGRTIGDRQGRWSVSSPS